MKRTILVVLFSIISSSIINSQNFTASKDPKTGLFGYKSNGVWIISAKYETATDFSENYAAVSLDGKYGYIDINGNIIIGIEYEDAKPFSSGLAPVRKYGKYGFINKEGDLLIPYKYDDANSFSEGLAAVQANGKYSYINTSGETIIPFMLDSADPFVDGLAQVVLNYDIKYINKEGKIFESRNDIYNSFIDFAKYTIEEKVNSWQKKGRYEKTSQWRQRVNEQTRAKLIDSLTSTAEKEFISYWSKNINLEQTILGYDADNESFYIKDSFFGSLIVRVPLNEAEYFEKNFKSTYKTPEYAISNNSIGLKKLTYALPNDKLYLYDNSKDLTFAISDISYEFDNIDININDIDNLQDNTNQQITSNKISMSKSDIDINIPSSRQINENFFAVIIANENYQRETKVKFAINDGRTFSKYCNKTLGIPEKNIRLIENATLNNIIAEVDWITKVAQAYKGKAGIIFYYAGHGIPDESTGESYLLPVDGYGSNTATGYKLQKLYSSLSNVNSKFAYVFIDACFSGAERGGTMLASARGVAIKAKPATPSGNLIVFTASQGDETAYPYEEKSHGMFTYFLLKKIKEKGYNISLGELAQYVKDEVAKQSIVINSKTQTPTIMVSPEINTSWEEKTLIP